MNHELTPDFPSYKLLSENGYEFVEQVRDASDTALQSIKGIGPKALEEIRVVQEEVLSQESLFELESEPLPVPEPVAPPEPASEPETVRVTVNVGRLYHAGRFYTRGDTVVLSLATAASLRAQEHVRY